MSRLDQLYALLVYCVGEEAPPADPDNVFANPVGKIVHCEVYDTAGLPIDDMLDALAKKRQALAAAYPPPRHEIVKEGWRTMSGGKDAADLFRERYPECKDAPIRKLL